METPSSRRVYRSRACRRAVAASSAWTLPTCVCDRPRLGRTNTSERSVMAPPRCARSWLLAGVGGGRVAYPLVLVVGAAGVTHRAPVGRAVARHDGHELGEV